MFGAASLCDAARPGLPKAMCGTMRQARRLALVLEPVAQGFRLVGSALPMRQEEHGIGRDVAQLFGQLGQDRKIGLDAGLAAPIADAPCRNVLPPQAGRVLP